MRIRVLAASVILAVLAATAFAQTQKPSQAAMARAWTITAKVLAFDQTNRKITLQGPLGGEIVGTIADEVQGIDKIKVGDMWSATYFEAVAATIRRNGESQPLFSAADAGAMGYPGQAVKAGASMTKSYTVVSVDPDTNTLVVQDSAGILFTRVVQRPEFVEKLKDVHAGDQLDITYSDAYVTKIEPVAPGEEAKATMSMGTLVISHGEVMKRSGNTLLIKNDKGRMLQVVADPSFKFLLDGKEATVADLKEGMKLSKIAIRVTSVRYTQ